MTSSSSSLHTMASLPKAVLYYSPDSVWSDAVALALAEKGYSPDELDRRIVNLSKGENLTVTYLRLNIKGTVPTLVVPFRDSLADDVESRYKALTDPKAIIDFLDQSRSPISRTRTTSTQPAPTLRPATVAYAAATSALLDIIHADDVSPERLALLNARDHKSLKTLATTTEPFVAGIQKTLAQCLAEAEAGSIQASDKVKTFWRSRLGECEELLAVLRSADKADAELDATAQKQREDYLKKAKTAWEVDVKAACIKLNQDIIGPYALGEQFSIADISLAAWLRKIVQLAGGGAGDEGLATLEGHIGGGFVFEKGSKLSIFWENARDRASWKFV
ncbi:hypothetical protein C8F01DRAFT_1108877, partial [Mycena amicta]